MPGNSCSLCKRSWGHTVSMFSPPRDEYMRGEWESACGVKLSQNTRLCAKHFTAKDFASKNLRRTRLTPDAVPSLNLHPTPVKAREPDESSNFTDNHRKARATVEQLNFFVNFTRQHPEILASKFGVVSELWEELSNQLNAMDGAYRTAEKWKDSMGTWRSQLRSRARRGKSSGVPEFDEFALISFRQQVKSRNEEGELAELENTDNEITILESNKFNEMSDSDLELEVEIKLEPEENIEIKTEIECLHDDNTTNAAELCKVISQQDSEMGVILHFKEEIEVQTDNDYVEDENATGQPQTSNGLVSLPTLGFPQTSSSNIFVIPRPATTMNTSTKSASEADDHKGVFLNAQAITNSNNCKKTCKATAKEKGITVLSRPLTLSNNSTQFVDEPCNIKSGSILISQVSKPLSKRAHALEKVNKEGGTVLPHTYTAASEFKSESAGGENFITEDYLQSAPSPITQAPKDFTDASKKRKSTTLNDMYETVLKSIKKREEREEQIIVVLQGLTGAVTRLADNVKRLEEVFTLCAQDKL